MFKDKDSTALIEAFNSFFQHFPLEYQYEETNTTKNVNLSGTNKNRRNKNDRQKSEKL